MGCLETDVGIRIGVYVCHCGTNIAGMVDVEQVVDYVRSLPFVAVARDYRYMCSEPGQEIISNDIRELGLNRIVIASCSPRLHEHTFRKVCQHSGLNPYLYEQINIREQCSWVHNDRKTATGKATDLIIAGVRRVCFNEPLEIKEAQINPNVLVVGAGIAGIQAALDIADSQQKVYLVEREPSIGGHMIQLDRTFPTLDCSECILTPKMTTVGQHPFIELLSYSEVEEVSGSIGSFKVKIRKKARFVNESKCIGCGICEVKCPSKLPSEFEMGLGKRGAIYIPFPQAIPNVPVIDKEHCIYFLKGKCRACEKFCEAGAIDFEQTDQFIELEVGSIIVATGYDIFDASLVSQYGYKRYDNILTGLEFERMTCAGGPTGGRVLLKNGQVPESVAIVHCVGSRDQNYHEYCSRVCCMYSLKYSYLLKELTQAEVYQMYIDMRCFGAGYEEFYKRCSDMGVNLIRGKVGNIIDDGNGKLIVSCMDTILGKIVEVPVDMVILAAALEPRSDTEEVARLFSLSCRADGFLLEAHPKLAPVNTPTDGIFIAGCCAGPKDIPDTVAQASAAAAKALSLIGKGKVELEAAIAQIDDSLCQGCGRCEEVCDFHAAKVTNKNGILVSTINETLCKGCGACGVVCPTGAISIKHFTRKQILSMVEALSER